MRMCVRAVDVLLCQNDVLSCQSHDMRHPVAQSVAQELETLLDVHVHVFPSLRVGGVWERD